MNLDPVPSLELRQARVFLVLCEELSFARTAERVGLTPSRVSQTIRAMESALGATLFERSSRRVALTPVGTSLRDDLAPAYARMQRAFLAAHDAAHNVTGLLCVGTYYRGNLGERFDEITERFATQNPGAGIEIRDTLWDSLAWLRRGDADVIAQRLPISDSDLTVGPRLSSEDRVVLVAEAHPLASRTSIVWDDVAPYPVTDAPDMPREMLDAFAPPRTSDGTPLRRWQAATFSELRPKLRGAELVHPTVASITRHTDTTGLTTVPVVDLARTETALVWISDRETQAIRALAQIAEDVMPEGVACRR